MLTGHTTITKGSAFIDGFNVATSLGAVYKRLGVCPQFDCVWTDLTVREHFLFYARLKGIEGKKIVPSVQGTAEKVSLDGDSFGSAASGLSGGQRRRLSCGIALLGSPPVVFLDEPTTGLDPSSRREVWRIVQSERSGGRAIVLTTHSMEECEALCSRIAIMAKGQLATVGSSLVLRKKFGEGYRLVATLVQNSRDFPTLEVASSAFNSFVHQELTRYAKLVSRIGTTATYVIPKSSGLDIATLFMKLQEGCQQQNAMIGISDYGISQATLEEVFIRVVEAAEL